jgi:peptidoglycan/xylan/chitin deacetylase (PgdA/CDA1 family)
VLWLSPVVGLVVLVTGVAVAVADPYRDHGDPRPDAAVPQRLVAPRPLPALAAAGPVAPTGGAGAPVQPERTRVPRDVSAFAALTVPPGDGASVALTFDDGPSAVFTPQVLALLEGAGAPAVFCVIGRQAVEQPSLLQREVSGGFRLCDHSRDHDLQMRRRGAGYEAAEVADGLHEIQAVVPGTPVTLYRQPGGLWDASVVAAAQRLGMTPLRWSDDPRDWTRPGAVAIAQRVLLGLRPGAVVLLHDGGGDRTQTVEALAWLLRALPAAGWHFTLPPASVLSPAQAAQPQ